MHDTGSFAVDIADCSRSINFSGAMQSDMRSVELVFRMHVYHYLCSELGRWSSNGHIDRWTRRLWAHGITCDMAGSLGTRNHMAWIHVANHMGYGQKQYYTNLAVVR